MVFKQIIEKITKEFSKFDVASSKSNITYISYKIEHDFTIELFVPELLLNLLTYLKNEPTIDCKQLIDLCGVDYLHYGKSEWDTNNATKYGFSRAVNKNELKNFKLISPTRFAVVYHLLSYSNNLRIRVKCFLDNDRLLIPSCVNLWPSANWYEREAFDLFGINFLNHPNLTKILTEDNFEGFPFR